jgi:hypothetical protein
LINRLSYQNIHTVEGNIGPYTGFSVDGNPTPGIFEYGEDEGAPVGQAVEAVKALWKALGSKERGQVRQGDVREDERFRVWSNPELYVNPGELESDSLVGVVEWRCEEGRRSNTILTLVTSLFRLLCCSDKWATTYFHLPPDHPHPTLQPPGGIRLDAPQTSPHTQTLIHDILKSSLSPEGYAKALGCTWTNAFLGELVGGQGVLNEHSYNFRLFLPESATSRSGSGSDGKEDIDTGPAGENADEDDDALEDLSLLTRPWGWSFFGHHLCLNVVFVGKRMIVGPTFMGAEPDRIDEGPHKGTRLFTQEEIGGLNLMRDLSEGNRKRAQVNVDMKEGLGEDRWNPFDER